MRMAKKVNLEQFSLDGKVAVVTGCSSGIGAGIAIGLADAGADVIGIDIAELKTTSEMVCKTGRDFYSISADLAEMDAVRMSWEKAVSFVGKVDILVNNAGMQYRSTAYDYPAEMFDKIIAVNLRSAYYLSQFAAKHFISKGIRGKIINLASLFSTFGGVNVSGYTCSKHGVLGMTKAMSNEFAASGINVNALAPGYISTDLTKAIWSDSKKRAPMDVRIPIGRWGEPRDFAGVTVFLASSASDYITGVMIPVDGGYSNR